MFRVDKRRHKGGMGGGWSQGAAACTVWDLIRQRTEMGSEDTKNTRKGKNLFNLAKQILSFIEVLILDPCTFSFSQNISKPLFPFLGYIPVH